MLQCEQTLNKRKRKKERLKKKEEEDKGRYCSYLFTPNQKRKKENNDLVE